MTDDQNLLAEYARSGSDAAFRELVARFVDLVYSTALRLVEGDTHQAEDVTQTVFVDLARQARTLSREVRLGGWLHRHTCFVAANTLRGERRRQARERQAVEMNVLQNNPGADYSQVAPMLDEAINEMEEADRTAILLRFFEQQDFRSVGEALGSTEDAARMRVTRALEKLKGFLKRQGVTTSAASLGVVLAANAVQAAPVGLAVTISTAAALAGTTLATTAIATATKAIAMTTLQKTVVAAVLAAAVGAAIYQATREANARIEVQKLQQRQAPLAETIKMLNRERDEAANKLAALQEENLVLKKNSAELLRLRGRVAQLQAELNSRTLTSAAGATSTNDLTEANTGSVLGRIVLLKQRLKETPKQSIPEIQLLNDDDWLHIGELRPPLSVTLDNETGVLRALSQVRLMAKRKFARRIGNAVKSFANENAGRLPTDVLSLKSYFDSQAVMPEDLPETRYSIGISARPVDPSQVRTYPPLDLKILQRYDMAAAGSIDEIQPDQTIVSEKPPSADEPFDQLFKIGLSSYVGYAADGSKASHGTWSNTSPTTQEPPDSYRQRANGVHERINDILRRTRPSTNR